MSWTPAETVLQLDPALGGWGGCQPVASDDCEIHVLLMCDAGTGVFGLPGQPREPKPLLERHLDVWHARTDEHGSRWRKPVRIWQGYTGSINSAIQMQNGRLVLPFAQLTDRTWRARGEGLDAFWFAGTSETIVLTSDDGEAWRIHDAELKVQTPSIGTYGAVEPVVIERRPNDLWMLIRTQLGRFYESFSADGTQWTAPRPSALLSSDSPAGLVRLSDDRLVLLWNKCLRFPYAHGGRHVLHAAVSADHGHSWIGHREVARDPRNYEPPPPGGDHGTAYPFPVALPDDRVLITTGQGEGRILLIALDPDWLCETQQRSSFVVADAPKHDTPPIDGRRLPDDWSAFGCAGVDVVDLPLEEANHSAMLQIGRSHSEWPSCAVWNHPLGRQGAYRLRLRLAPNSEGCRLLLTDHFSIPFDPEDAHAALFYLLVLPPTQALLSEGEKLHSAGEVTLVAESDVWHDIDVIRGLDERSMTASVGKQRVTASARHLGDGVCYLRLKPASTTINPGFCLATVHVTVKPHAREQPVKEKR